MCAGRKGSQKFRVNVLGCAGCLFLFFCVDYPPIDWFGLEVLQYCTGAVRSVRSVDESVNSKQYLKVRHLFACVCLRVLALQVSPDERFDEILGVSDTYIPAANVWVGEYPYLDKVSVLSSYLEAAIG